LYFYDVVVGGGTPPLPSSTHNIYSTLVWCTLVERTEKGREEKRREGKRREGKGIISHLS
jgi:hypothetical protein